MRSKKDYKKEFLEIFIEEYKKSRGFKIAFWVLSAIIFIFLTTILFSNLFNFALIILIIGIILIYLKISKIENKLKSNKK